MNCISARDTLTVLLAGQISSLLVVVGSEFAEARADFDFDVSVSQTSLVLSWLSGLSW